MHCEVVGHPPAPLHHHQWPVNQSLCIRIRISLSLLVLIFMTVERTTAGKSSSFLFGDFFLEPFTSYFRATEVPIECGLDPVLKGNRLENQH